MKLLEKTRNMNNKNKNKKHGRAGKVRWAIRFRKDAQESKQPPKGPWTHLGPYLKDVLESVEEENPLMEAALEGEVMESEPVARVLGGVVESVTLAETVVEGVVDTEYSVAPTSHKPNIKIQEFSNIITEK